MFGRFKKKRQKEDVNKEVGDEGEVREAFDLEELEKRKLYIRAMMEEKKIPIVVIDPLWYSMKEHITTATIRENEKKLNELMKEQGKLNTDTIEYDKVKKNLLKKILEVSQEVNDQGDTTRLNELETLQQSIAKTNENLEAMEERLQEVEKLIEQTNRSVVEEAMALAYTYMSKYKQKKKTLEDEIDYLRQQVILKTEEKKNYDKQYSVLYNYLHKVIGYKYIDQMDKKLGENKT